MRIAVPADAQNATMKFSLKADNRAQVAINGVSTGPEIVGQANGVNADAVFSQNLHAGENTITLNIGDEGGLNGFNFRIDLTVKSQQPLEIVPPIPPDTRPPVITAPADITAEATSGAGAVVTFDPTAVDDVDGTVRVIANPPSGSTFALGTTPVGLAASDAAHNTGTASFDVTVVDTTAPVITAPAPVSAEATSAAGAAVSYAAATATDAVTAAPAITYSAASGSTFALGDTRVNITATDGASNSSTSSFTVTVKDTTAPALTVPDNVTGEATSAAGAAVAYPAATATDAVTAAPTITYSAASGSTFALGTTTVNVSVQDGAHNTNNGSFTVTVLDTTPPTLTLPDDQVIEATSAAGAVAIFGASATDAVTASPTITYSGASGATYPIGTTTVNVAATDGASNVSRGSFTIRVRDTTAPALTVPADLVLEATSAAGAVATFGASATDAVTANPAIAYSAASGGTFPIGTTTVNVAATDGASNVSRGSFTITVRDTTAPAIASATPSSATLWPPNHQMVAISVGVVASDNTGYAAKIINVTSSEPDNGLGDGDTAGDCQITGDLTVNLRAERAGKGNGRVYTITVEARDAYGNASTTTCTVSVPKSQGRR